MKVGSDGAMARGSGNMNWLMRFEEWSFESWGLQGQGDGWRPLSA